MPRLTPWRVSAFTLLELVVVLAVSALLFRLAYAALELVQRQQLAYERHSARLWQVSGWQRTLAADLRRAGRVEAAGDELRCQLLVGPVVYQWRDSTLVRQQAGLADTLAVPVRAGSWYWRGRPRTHGLVDEVGFVAVTARDTFYLQATASYTAQQLLGDTLSPTP